MTRDARGFTKLTTVQVFSISQRNIMIIIMNPLASLATTTKARNDYGKSEKLTENHWAMFVWECILQVESEKTAHWTPLKKQKKMVNENMEARKGKQRQHNTQYNIKSK